MLIQEQVNRAQIVAELVGPSLGSAIGAALAAYFAILWGTSQFRDQRAFDRRLNWYEQTSRALAEFQGAIKEVLVSLQLETPTLVAGLEKLSEKLSELSLHLQHAELYVSDISMGSVLRLREQLDTNQHRLRGCSSHDDARENSLRLLREVLETWQPRTIDARYALTAEIRRHLGLSALPRVGVVEAGFTDLMLLKLGWKKVSQAGHQPSSAGSV